MQVATLVIMTRLVVGMNERRSTSGHGGGDGLARADRRRRHLPVLAPPRTRLARRRRSCCSRLGGAAVGNVIMLARVKDFAWERFFQVARWSLLAYAVIAGMIEYAFLENHVRGGTLVDPDAVAGRVRGPRPDAGRIHGGALLRHRASGPRASCRHGPPGRRGLTSRGCGRAGRRLAGGRWRGGGGGGVWVGLPASRRPEDHGARIAGQAPVAQLDRASVYGTEGREFESLRARCRSPASGAFSSVAFPRKREMSPICPRRRRRCLRL